MKVYVLEIGCYDERHIAGVYETVESAMAAHSPEKPPAPEPKICGRRYDETTGETTLIYSPPITSRQTYTWSRQDDGSWWFDESLDCAWITEHEVQP